MSNGRDFLSALFERWNKAGMPYLILRNYASLPESGTGDIDILIDAQWLDRAEASMVACGHEFGFRLVNRAWFSPLALFFANLSSGEQVHLDLFPDLVWRGLRLLDERKTLERRREHPNGFPIPHQADEAVLNLLTRLLYTRKVKERYRPGIQAGFSREREGVLEILRAGFGSAAEEMFGLALGGQWHVLEAKSTRWRLLLAKRRLLREPLKVCMTLLWDLSRYFRRLRRPPGLLIVLLGPDGAGKSTLATGLQKGLSRSFPEEKNLHVHWKPAPFGRHRMAGPPETDPHGRPARPLALSCCYLAYHWLGFLAGGLTTMLPIRFRGGMVTVDRYFHDILVDARRYRLHKATPGVRGLLRFLTDPDLIFVLDAPAEVLHLRKAEVSLEETRRQLAGYQQIAREFSQTHILDVSRSEQAVIDHGLRVVLEYLASRAGHTP